MIPHRAHPMIRSEDERRQIVAEIICERRDRLLDHVVKDTNRAMVLGAVRPVRVPRRVQAQKMEEEEGSLCVELLSEGGGRRRVGKECSELVENP